MLKYLWIWIIIIVDLGLFFYIFKELPYAIKHKEVKEFFENDAGIYIAVHIGVLFVVSLCYWMMTLG